MTDDRAGFVVERVWLELHHFHFGAKSAVTKADASAHLGITTREFEHAVQSLRMEERRICTDSHGYFVAEKPEELRNTCRSLRGRAVTQLRTYGGVKRALERWERREKRERQAVLFVEQEVI